MVRLRAAHDVEYASNVDPPSYPDGYDVEVLTKGCLDRLDREAAKPHEREHVTARIRERPNEYTRVNVAWDRDVSSLRLTVDVPEDLVRVAAVLAALPPSPPPDAATVVAHLEAQIPVRDQGEVPGRDDRYRAQRDAALREEASG